MTEPWQAGETGSQEQVIDLVALGDDLLAQASKIGKSVV